MSIQKSTEIAEVTVSQNGVVYYEEVTTVTEDGVELAKKHHRVVLNPGQDLAGQPANVVLIATAAWTPEVLQAYEVSSQPRGIPAQ